MNEGARKITQCRSCGSPALDDIFSLGDMYVSAFVADADEQKEMQRYPLDIILCNEGSGGCGLLQLRHTVPSEVMYRNYWYRSGTNQTMTNELYGIVAAARRIKTVGKGDIVIDIGCNDGTLLSAYPRGEMTRVGFRTGAQSGTGCRNKR